MKTNPSLALVLGIACVALGACSKKNVVKGPIPSGEYVVMEGDSLSRIAIRAYGDMNLWKPLLNANRQIATRPQFRLDIGDTLTIPEKSKLELKLPVPEYPKRLPADYVVLPGDSMLTIAKGCYGNEDAWMLVYDANRTKLSSRVKEDPKQPLSIEGQVLNIPAKESHPEALRHATTSTAK